MLRLPCRLSAFAQTLGIGYRSSGAASDMALTADKKGTLLSRCVAPFPAENSSSGMKHARLADSPPDEGMIAQVTRFLFSERPLQPDKGKHGLRSQR